MCEAIEYDPDLYFTFHNVSINTQDCIAGIAVHGLNFTFHNVSINTEGGRTFRGRLRCFTFHNVSINTLSQQKLQMLQQRLYIPQCFY